MQVEKKKTLVPKGNRNQNPSVVACNHGLDCVTADRLHAVYSGVKNLHYRFLVVFILLIMFHVSSAFETQTVQLLKVGRTPCTQTQTLAAAFLSESAVA